MKKGATIAATIIFILTACTRMPVYHQYRSTPIGGWKRADTLCFDVDTIRKTQTCQLSVGLRTSTAEEYPFLDIYLVVEQEWKKDSATVLLQDTIKYEVTNNEGDAQGDGIMLRQLSTTIPKTFTYQKGATGKIKIRHAMNPERVTGIADVGVEILPVEYI